MRPSNAETEALDHRSREIGLFDPAGAEAAQIRRQKGKPTLNCWGSLDRGQPPQADAGISVLCSDHRDRMERSRVLDDNSLNKEGGTVAPAPNLFRLDDRGPPPPNLSRQAARKAFEIYRTLEDQVGHQSNPPARPTKENATRR
jgi:hypothetical protein